MKSVFVGLTAIVMAMGGLGCSKELSEAELKKSEEEMKKESEKISEDLPAKID
jgi:hypothetical protein